MLELLVKGRPQQRHYLNMPDLGARLRRMCCGPISIRGAHPFATQPISVGPSVDHFITFIICQLTLKCARRKMNPRYAYILPLGGSSDPGSEDSSAGPLGATISRTRARRSAVPIACDACRRKKIRVCAYKTFLYCDTSLTYKQCDGQRPTCASCAGDTPQCTYRDDEKRTTKGSPAIEAVVRLLDSLPTEQVEQVLGVLKSQAGPARVASVLRGGIDITQRPSGLAIGATTLGSSLVSQELEIHNPVAYPFLAPIHDIPIEQDTINRLTQPRGGPLALPL